MNDKNEALMPKYITSDNSRVPVVNYPFRHCVKLQIRFTDVDMFGHVNNNVYLSMMDLGKLSYYNAVMDGALDFHKIGMVVVSITSNFHAPTYITEHIEVWTTVKKISEHSFTLDQRIINSDNGQVKCSAQTVLCAIGPEGESMKLAPEWIDALNKYEQRPIQQNISNQAE